MLKKSVKAIAFTMIIAMLLTMVICPAAMAVSFKVKADGSAKVYLSSGSTTKVSSGTGMTVTAVKRGWAKVKKDGKSGYVKTSSLKPATGSNLGNAVAYALLQVGKSYGNNEPSSFNCSSLVFYCYKKYGIHVPGTAKEIAEDSDLTMISSTHDLKMGDILCFDTNSDGTCDHVGIFIDGRKFVEASQSNDVVQLNDLDSWYKRHFLCARRP